MAKLPGVDGVFGSVMALLQAQTEALAALRGPVPALSNAAGGLAETVQKMNSMVSRIDGIVTELEEPLKALAPGMTRVAAILDSPGVDEIPATLAQVQSDILPVLRTLADTHERVAVIAGSTARLMRFVADTSRPLAAIPGAALLGRRRAVAKPEPKVIVPPATSTGPTEA